MVYLFLKKYIWLDVVRENTKSSKQVTLRGLVFPLDFIEMDIFEIKIKRRKSKKVFATTIRNLFTLTNYVEQSVSVMFD